jgi:hypothetical protein
MGTNFDISPPRDSKVEFPRTAEGIVRRIVFYAGATVAVLCALVVVSSIAVAIVSIAERAIHAH